MWRGISKRSLAFLLMICLILQGMMPIEVSGATVERSGYVYREDTQMYYIAQNEAGEFQVVWRDSNAVEQRVEAEKFQIYQMINGEYILDPTQKAVVTQDSYSNWKLMAETIETEEQTADMDTTQSYYVEGPKRYYLGIDAVTICKDGNRLSSNYLIETEESAITFTQMEQFEAHIDWRDGAIEAARKTEARGSAPKELNVKIYQTISGKTSILEPDQYDILLKDRPEGDHWDISVKGLPKYVQTDKTVECSYYLTCDPMRRKDQSGEGADYYEPSYDNGMESTETDRLVPGGTMDLTLSNDMVYESLIHWHDDQTEESIQNRPDAQVSLWRYPDRDCYTYATGAPVKKNGVAAEGKLQRAENAQEGEAQTRYMRINRDTFTSVELTQEDFPKYDGDGYEYIYYVKESLADTSYVMRFQSTQKAEDELWYWAEDTKRTTSTDPVLYNGEILDNVRANAFRIKVKTTWKSKATSYITDATKMQFGFEQVTENGRIQVEPETTEILSEDTVAYTFPKYDAKGMKCNYELAGISYYYANKEHGKGVIDYTQESDGSYQGRFRLMEDQYISAYTKSVSKDAMTIDLVNHLVGTVQISVEKRWHGSGWKTEPAYQILKEAAKKGEPRQEYLTFGITRKRNHVTDHSFYKEMTGYETQIPMITTKQDVEISEDALGDDFAIWRFPDLATQETGEFAKYDEEGYRYEYSLFDEEYVGVERPENASVRYTYEVEDNYDHITLVAENYIAGGRTIHVMKKWQDDGDVYRRGVSEVHLCGKRTADGPWLDLTEDGSGMFSSYRADLMHANSYDVYIGYDPHKVSEQGYVELGAFEYSLDNSRAQYNNGKIAENGSAGSEPDDMGTIATVQDQEHMYQITTDMGEVTGEALKVHEVVHITNTRIGFVDIPVTIRWVDGHNAQNTRPEKVQIRLFQNGVPYQELIELPDPSVNTSETDEWSKLDRSFTALPKYDRNGAIYEYRIEQIAFVGENTEYETEVAALETAKVEPAYQKGKVDDVCPFVICNTLQATLHSFQAYILWRDEARLSARPDVYVTLNRKVNGVRDEQYQNTQMIWTHPTDKEELAKYQDICNFYELEKYDSQGYAYTYYVNQTMNGGSYQTSYYDDRFQDAQKGPDTKMEHNAYQSGHTILKAGLCKKELTADSADGAENGQFIVNRIRAAYASSGKKIWANVEKGITSYSELPDIELTMYRSSIYDEEHAYENGVPLATARPEEAEGQKILVGAYHFEGEDLYKYDDYGAAYTYDLREKISQVGEAGVIDQLYEGKFDVDTMSFQNVYLTGEKNQQRIVVNKTWKEIDPSYQSMVAAKFYICGFEDQKAAERFLAKVRTNDQTVAERIAALCEDGGNLEQTLVVRSENKSQNVNWVSKRAGSQGVRIYSPKGIKYTYIVVEEDDVTDGYVIDPTQRAVKVDNYSITALNEEEGTLPETEVSFENIHVHKKIDQIKGNMIWSGNTTIKQPEDPSAVRLEVFRHTTSQDLEGVNNAIEEEKVEDIQAVWTVGRKGVPEWKYEITGDLLVYAPNGQPYIYTVKASPAQESVYLNDYNVTVATKADAAMEENGILQVPDLANELKKITQITGIQKWADDGNVYRPDPSKVAFKLYRYTEQRKAWQEVTQWMLRWTDTQKDSWRFVIKDTSANGGFDFYDSNGEIYTYVLKETAEFDGYESAYQKIGQQDADAEELQRRSIEAQKLESEVELQMGTVVNTLAEGAKKTGSVLSIVGKKRWDDQQYVYRPLCRENADHNEVKLKVYRYGIKVENGAQIPDQTSAREDITEQVDIVWEKGEDPDIWEYMIVPRPAFGKFDLYMANGKNYVYVVEEQPLSGYNYGLATAVCSVDVTCNAKRKKDVLYMPVLTNIRTDLRDSQMAKITGSIYWRDEGYVYRPDPSEVSLSLSRYCVKELQDGTYQERSTEESVPNIRFTWTSTCNCEWTFEILPTNGEGFEQYSADGRTYVYVIKEDAKENATWALKYNTENEGTFLLSAEHASSDTTTIDGQTVLPVGTIVNTLIVQEKKEFEEIRGQLKWRGENYVPRKDQVNLELGRYSVKENGTQEVEIVSTYEKVEQAQLEWLKDTKDSNDWNYRFVVSEKDPFPGYALDGSRYIYVVQEVAQENRQWSGRYNGNRDQTPWTKRYVECSIRENADTGKAILRMPALVNNMTGKLTADIENEAVILAKEAETSDQMKSYPAGGIVRFYLGDGTGTDKVREPNAQSKKIMEEDETKGGRYTFEWQEYNGWVNTKWAYLNYALLCDSGEIIEQNVAVRYGNDKGQVWERDLWEYTMNGKPATTEEFEAQLKRDLHAKAGSIRFDMQPDPSGTGYCFSFQWEQKNEDTDVIDLKMVVDFLPTLAVKNTTKTAVSKVKIENGVLEAGGKVQVIRGTEAEEGNWQAAMDGRTQAGRENYINKQIISVRADAGYQIDMSHLVIGAVGSFPSVQLEDQEADKITAAFPEKYVMLSLDNSGAYAIWLKEQERSIQVTGRAEMKKNLYGQVTELRLIIDKNEYERLPFAMDVGVSFIKSTKIDPADIGNHSGGDTKPEEEEQNDNDQDHTQKDENKEENDKDKEDKVRMCRKMHRWIRSLSRRMKNMRHLCRRISYRGRSKMPAKN